MCVFNVEHIQKAKQEKKSIEPVSQTSIILQWVMLVTMLLTFPLALLVVEVMFYYGTIHIHEDILDQLWRENFTEKGGGWYIT